MIDHSDILLNLFADDKNLITYRPRWASVVGSITAAIFLQQVFFWWHRQGQQPFYKFNAPCEHALYKPGDSWTESLGFTKSELATARDKVSVKKTANMTMEDAIELARKTLKPVVYWTDAGRVTHYTIIPDVFESLLHKAYGDNGLNQESGCSKINNRDLAKSGFPHLVNQDSGNRSTETTTETTTETGTSNDDAAPPHPVSALLEQESLPLDDVLYLFDQRKAGNWPEGVGFNPAGIIARLWKHRFGEDVDVKSTIPALARAFGDWRLLAESIHNAPIAHDPFTYLLKIGHSANGTGTGIRKYQSKKSNSERVQDNLALIERVLGEAV